MKKKRGGGGGANWMDTYGDMVTLLLCFFVLLYSMSTISEENYKALVMSFNPRAIPVPTETMGGNGPIADAPDDAGFVDVPSDDMTQTDIDDAIEQLAAALESYAKEEGLENNLAVELSGGKVYVTFNETAFFAGDSAVLRPEATEMLGRVCGILDGVSDYIEELRVQGHTAQADPDEPNPVTGDRKLASDRATNVIIFLQQHSKIHPARLVAEAFGQWRPVDSNKTAATRANNRRVEMVISGRNLEEELAGTSLLEVTKHSTAESGTD